MDYELFRNGSGYVDYTAYKAILNIERDKKMEFNRGEIFEYETFKNENRKALIVSADSRKNNEIQSVILLIDEPKTDKAIPVVCEGMMYAECDLISFVRSDRLINFIRVAREEEMAKVDAGIAQALGIEQEKTEIVIEKRSEPVEFTIEKNKPVIFDPKPASVEVFSEELIKAQTEAETYKNLYDQLLSKVLNGQQS